jgi:hypothetical protein
VHSKFVWIVPLLSVFGSCQAEVPVVFMRFNIEPDRLREAAREVLAEGGTFSEKDDVMRTNWRVDDNVRSSGPGAEPAISGRVRYDVIFENMGLRVEADAQVQVPMGRRQLHWEWVDGNPEAAALLKRIEAHLKQKKE